ncbi:MAG: thioredoxin family protein [Labilithrix sp.]|nr:thioredoxin family protein [Labilithrix sp.]
MGIRGMCAALAPVGVLMLSIAGSSACGKSSVEPPPTVWHDLATGEAIARKEHKPAVVFFFAEWSVADKMLAEQTFPDPDVRAAMKDFVAIKVDVTNDEDRAVRRAQERFLVVGVPTIIVLASFDPPPDDASARLRNDELFRAHEFMKPGPLAASLRSAKQQLDRR